MDLITLLRAGELLWANWHVIVDVLAPFSYLLAITYYLLALARERPRGS